MVIFVILEYKIEDWYKRMQSYVMIEKNNIVFNDYIYIYTHICNFILYKNTINNLFVYKCEQRI